MMRRAERSGLTLTEILIAVVILSLCAIPVIGVYIMGKDNIMSTDVRRRHHFYIREIYSRVNRTSLHNLWNYFGPKGYNIPGAGTIPPFGQSGKFRDRLAEFDPTTGKLFPGQPKDVNPLGFTEEFLKDLTANGFEGQVSFEFFTKKGLQVTPHSDPNDHSPCPPHPAIGIMHMQAGWCRIRIADLKSPSNPKEILAEELFTIMCPAIVGRPGLKLSSCPAIAPETHQIYNAILDQYEASLPDPPPW